MKILHLASFIGNIGDNASHIGLNAILKKIFNLDFASVYLDQLEIRRFYKNYTLGDKLNFDFEFAKFVNTYDLLIIGGGGFLDFWIPDSQTGTTIDWSDEFISKLSVPILITSVGAMPHKPIPDGNIEKFRKFIDRLLAREKTIIAVRNDGSLGAITEYLGKNYAERITQVLDNAFFFTQVSGNLLLTDKEFIVVNTTLDQVKMVNKKIGIIDANVYKQELAKFLNYVITDTKYQIVFVPHIYSDIRAISGVIEQLNDFEVRSRVIVAPHVQGNSGCNQLFSLYQKSVVNIGMRFHSNVCSLSLGNSSIALAALDRVINMYESMGLSNESYVSVDHAFHNELIKKFESTIANREVMLKNRNLLIEKSRAESLKKYQMVFQKLL